MFNSEENIVSDYITKNTVFYDENTIEKLYSHDEYFYEKLIRGKQVHIETLTKKKINTIRPNISELKSKLEKRLENIEIILNGANDNELSLCLMNNYCLTCHIFFKNDRVFLEQHDLKEYNKILNYLNKKTVEYDIVGDNNLIQIKL